VTHHMCTRWHQAHSCHPDRATRWGAGARSPPGVAVPHWISTQNPPEPGWASIGPCQSMCTTTNRHVKGDQQVSSAPRYHHHTTHRPTHAHCGCHVATWHASTIPDPPSPTSPDVATADTPAPSPAAPPWLFRPGCGHRPGGRYPMAVPTTASSALAHSAASPRSPSAQPFWVHVAGHAVGCPVRDQAAAARDYWTRSAPVKV
jgi:hypothetical protein